MSKSIKGIKRQIRKWWMLITAPEGLVRIAGGYYILREGFAVPQVVAYPVVFAGISGWALAKGLPNRYFTNKIVAKQKSIEARFFIEFME
jgi:hypothetical protein